MNRALIKKLLVILTMCIVLLQGFAYAKSENAQTLKVGEKEYLIYVSGLLDKKFEFAFANNKEETNLEFVESATDEEDGKGNNVAYVDEEIYDTYFAGKAKTYIFVKQTENEDEKIEVEEIDLSKAIDEEKIQELNQTTNKIEVKFGEKELPAEEINGVTVNHKIGTIEIKGKEDAEYTYAMINVAENKEAKELIELANQINTLENKDMYTKLETYRNFEELYKGLIPSAESKEWKEVEEKTIPQPTNTKEGEQYLVLIKEKIGKEEIVDIQIMECRENMTSEYETKDVVIKETTKLPITYDNIALFVIAGILLILIIAVIALKLKNNKNKKEE